MYRKYGTLMKTYTADEFEREFYTRMFEWLTGDKQGPDPRGEWECSEMYPNNKMLWISHPAKKAPMFLAESMYRWKPVKKRTINIDGVELVAPEVDAPVPGAPVFVEWWDGNTSATSWCSSKTQIEALTNGKVFLTREDAQAMADAQRKQRLGGGV